MSSKRASIESGIGIDMSNERSAIKHFYDSFVPRLSSEIQQGCVNIEMDADDPTIDLDLDDHEIRAICSPKPIARYSQQQQQQQQQQQPQPKKKHQETFHVSTSRDLSLDELRDIVLHIRKKDSISDKLVNIMLDGLKNGLLKNSYYDIFIKDGPADNWCPIVKMNASNTPIVEILMKHDLSDEAPTEQLSEYSTEHMALSKFVLDHLHASAKCSKLTGPSQPQSKNQPRTSQSLNPQRLTTTNHNVQRQKENRHSLPVPMACSTPIMNRKQPPKRNSLGVAKTTAAQEVSLLNDSKRILPHRACKTVAPDTYRLPAYK